MKTLYHLRITICNKILSLILILLGFASCGDSDVIPEEYGTLPTSFLEMEGRVVDEADAPIEGMNIILKKRYTSLDYPSVDTVQTDASGAYTYENDKFYAGDYWLRVVCEDPSGTYESDSVTFKNVPSHEELVNEDGSTRYGARHEINFTMKKKTTAPEE